MFWHLFLRYVPSWFLTCSSPSSWTILTTWPGIGLFWALTIWTSLCDFGASMILTQKAGLNMLMLLLCFAKFHRPLVLANSACTVWLARYNQFRFSNFVSFPCNLTRFSKKNEVPSDFHYLIFKWKFSNNFSWKWRVMKIQVFAPVGNSNPWFLCELKRLCKNKYCALLAICM